MRMHSLIVALTLGLCACGFRPLYQSTDTLSGGNSALDSISIEDIGGQTGLSLKNNLTDRFYNSGYPENAPYALKIVMQEHFRDIVIQKNDISTRAQLVLRANYKLIDRKTRREIDSGTIRAVSSYNILTSQYTTLVTQNDARDMAVRELADKITLRLATVLNQAELSD